MCIDDKVLNLTQARNLKSDIKDMKATTDPLVVVERYFAIKDIIDNYKEQGYEMFHYKIQYTKAYHYAWDYNVR